MTLPIVKCDYQGCDKLVPFTKVDGAFNYDNQTYNGKKYCKLHLNEAKPKLCEICSTELSTLKYMGMMLCKECKEKEIIAQEELKSLEEERVRQSKACKGCLDRGIVNANEASHTLGGRFLCRDCYNIELEKSITLDKTPVITSADDILANRDWFFVKEATAIANKTPEEVALRIETLRALLFKSRIELEANQEYINKLRADQRKALSLSDSTYSPEAKPGAKPRLSKEDKQINELAKTMGITVEQATAIVRNARNAEFIKRSS